jgi:FlaA1/EpsC-like NDP-sugar epimerase
MIRTLSRFAAPALALPRAVKRGVVLALDAVLCILSVWLAFYLRLGEFSALNGPHFRAVYAALLIAIPTFVVFGMYRAIFRYSGLPAMLTVTRAMLVYGLIYATLFTVIRLQLSLFLVSMHDSLSLPLKPMSSDRLIWHTLMVQSLMQWYLPYNHLV